MDDPRNPDTISNLCNPPSFFSLKLNNLATPEVDQAVSRIKSILSQSRDKVLSEIIDHYLSLQTHKGITRIEDILLIYLEKHRELPSVYYNFLSI